MTTDYNTTATAILSRAAVLCTDDEEDLRRAIVEALQAERIAALLEGAALLVQWMMQDPMQEARAAARQAAMVLGEMREWVSVHGTLEVPRDEI